MIPCRSLARVAASAVAFALFAAPSVALAGPMAPAPGPVAPTGKPLAQVEPRTPVETLPGDAEAVYVISQPGSYYLTGNTTPAGGKCAIKITSGGVVLDLNGFYVSGYGAGAGPDGVRITGDNVPGVRQNIAIVNGSFKYWGGEAIDAVNCLGVTIDRVMIDNCAAGIKAGDQARISNSFVRASQAQGIVVGALGSVAECTVANNWGMGITAGTGARIAGCSLTGNNGGGVLLTDNGLVERCVITGNDQGVQAANKCTIRDNVIEGSRVEGVLLTGSRNRVDGNYFSSNWRGVKAATAPNILLRNSFAFSSTVDLELASGNHAPTVDGLNTTNPYANIRY